MGSASRLAMFHPDFFAELPNAISGQATQRTMEVMAAVYFSPTMDSRDTLQYLPLLEPESVRAVTEMAALPFRLASRKPDIPVLVMGGSEDAVFSPSMLYFTAASWKARMEVVPGAGHMLMLDPQWRDAAGRIADWLASMS
ncbi:MAG: alpha/beta hydrolase [Zoogloea sp.]|nr:alpha/beta hydrolase [Zoogloea sp.]